MLKRCAKTVFCVSVAGFLAACAPDGRNAEIAVAAPDAGAGPQSPTAQVQEAQAPEVHRGAALARHVCVACHDIGIGAPPASDLDPEVEAPSFAEVADRPGTDMASLREWMAAAHAPMPQFLLNETELDDVASYILSLR
ncbi:c-type cytochrome [bacterium]|nr:c-type cytochrome [bacterium]